MELSKEQFLQIIDECLKGQKDTIETDDFTFEFGEGKITVKEKVKEEKPKRWKPEMNEHFYIVGVGDDEIVEKWIWMNFDCDKALYEMGECFKTKEEAEFEAARRKFMKTFRDIAYEVNEPKEMLTHYPVWTGLEVTMIESSDPCWYGGETVGFTSKEAFYKAMEKVDQSELRKYYFGYKEN